MTTVIGDVLEQDLHIEVDDFAFYAIAEVSELDASTELVVDRVMLGDVREVDSEGSLEVC